MKLSHALCAIMQAFLMAAKYLWKYQIRFTTDLTFWPFNIALEMTIIDCIFINPGTLTKQTALPKYSWKKEVCDGT